MSLAVKYSSLRRAIGRFLGYPRDTGTWNTDQATDVDDCLAIGLRRFYWPVTPEGELAHSWSFLRKSTTVSLAAGDSDYDLPTDFVALIEDPFIVADDGGRIDEISPEDLLAIQARHAKSGTPLYCAVRPKTYVAASGTQYELLVHPTPEKSQSLVCPYTYEPAAISSDDYPPGGAVHGETILEACLAAAELTIGRVEEYHARRFAARLAASIQIDKVQRV